MGERGKLELLRAFADSQGWNITQGKIIPHGEQLVIANLSDVVQVNYWPKKSSIQIQGKDSALKATLQSWLDSNNVSKRPNLDTPSDNSIFLEPHIGMDESGKGDWFGSIVVAALYVDSTYREALQALGVCDSKKISSPRIEEIACEIQRLVPEENYVVYVVSPSEYNELYSQYNNLNTLLATLYSDAVFELWKRRDQPRIICDQFASKKELLNQTFTDHNLPIPNQQHHAESVSIAVAGASILARSAFLHSIQTLSQELGLASLLPLGSSDVSRLTQVAQSIIRDRGVQALEKVAKLNFAPIQRLLTDQTLNSPERDSTIAANVAGSHPSVRLELPIAWQSQYYEQGYWRFQFADGGILDWWSDHNGRLDVRGKESSTSYQILRERAHGKVMQPKNQKHLEELREKLEQRLMDVIPPHTLILQPALGVGWYASRQLYGTRLSFTDGSILQYYATTKTLLIQGSPSLIVREVLEQLPSPFYPGLDQLILYLRQLFPDWELGTPSSPETEQTIVGFSPWQFRMNSLNWQEFWPANRKFRNAANKREDVPCQKAFLDDWASVLVHHEGKKALLAQAPTGLGKTVSALVPALAWVAEDPTRRRIYYLVNRVAQHDNPIQELRNELAEIFHHKTGQGLRVVDMIGRSDLCISPNTQKLSSVCQQSRNESTFEHFPEGILSWRDVQIYANKQELCPYHCLQGLMKKAHLVICDYWWLFSETAQSQALLKLSGVSSRDSILIVDEAHNLPLRVRAELDIDATFADATLQLSRADTVVQSCLAPILDRVQNSPYEEGFVPSELSSKTVQDSVLKPALKLLQETEQTERKLSLPERLLKLLLKSDNQVIFYKSKDIDGNDRLICKLIDPTPVLRKGYELVYASLTMSGTLAAPADDSSELQYQTPLFGLPEQTLARRYASPFSLKNQQWIYVPDTYGVSSTREEYIPQYVHHITEIGKVTPGVTAVFFSSYQFLQQVQEAISDEQERLLIVAEQSGALNDEFGERSLDHYQSELKDRIEKNQRAYLFAVYQGKIAEGANFADNLIRTVICVSIPVEYPGLFHQKLQERYQVLLQATAIRLNQAPAQKALEYAFRRLVLSLVLQACGRGIRQQDDRCAFVLLDRRYGPGKGNYDWRSYLNPPPYNLRKPGRTIQNFHSPQPLQIDDEWDSVLLSACRGE